MYLYIVMRTLLDKNRPDVGFWTGEQSYFTANSQSYVTQGPLFVEAASIRKLILNFTETE